MFCRLHLSDWIWEMIIRIRAKIVRNNGIMEEWKNGMMEYWNIGILGNTGGIGKTHRSIVPTFHHSTISYGK